jgi:hypothetical protein
MAIGSDHDTSRNVSAAARDVDVDACAHVTSCVMTSSPTPTGTHRGFLLTDHTIVNPLAASRAAKTAVSTLEDVARVKEKYADIGRPMTRTRHDANCKNLGAGATFEISRVHPAGVPGLHPSPRAASAAIGSCLSASLSRPNGHPVTCEPLSLPVCSFTSTVPVYLIA